MNKLNHSGLGLQGPSLAHEPYEGGAVIFSRTGAPMRRIFVLGRGIVKGAG
jgi:hypothetical protein